MIPNQHIRDDLFRYEGRFSWFLFFRYFLFTPGFRYSCIWRWTQAASKLTKPFWILLLRHYQVKYAIQIPYQTKIGRGLKIGHWGAIVINPDATIGHNFNIVVYQDMPANTIAIGNPATFHHKENASDSLIVYKLLI